MRSLNLILAAALLVGCPLAAQAHAFLKTASPPVGGTIAAAPTEVAITFTEGVEPKFSTIEVRDDSGARVDRADPHSGAGGKTQLIVSLGALRPGSYAVSWSAVSVDTHHTEGKFTFTVGAGKKLMVVARFVGCNALWHCTNFVASNWCNAKAHCTLQVCIYGLGYSVATP